LIEERYLEPLRDFEHSGAKVLASRLGYRSTAKFACTFLRPIFDHPARVFPEELLRPEIQDLDAFVDGIRNVVEAQQRVAWQYFEDQSIEDACPSLLALLSIMANGTFEGKGVHQPEIRRMFTLEYLLESDWYCKRLIAKEKSDVMLWQRHLRYVDECLANHAHMWAENSDELLRCREIAVAELERARSSAYLDVLNGTLGLDPSLVVSTSGNPP